MLDAYDHRAWRNFALPWFDPALNPATEFGSKTLRWNLESQIIPVDAIILLDSVLAQESSRKWIDFEVELARRHSKPIIGVPGWGQIDGSPDLVQLSDAVCPWDVGRLFALVDQLS